MIWFVGAGSGAVDLITVRGQRLLGEADVVVYAGSLVNPELLGYARPGIPAVDSSALTLEKVLDVMLSAERDGKMTVRLHTGDPSLYGAVREQMDALTGRGIKFEVVPGVSSFTAAAAALGAEFTLPGVSQTVIIARTSGRTPVPEREALSELARHGASMAVFLSSGMLGQVQEQLLSGAYTEATPAAIVYKASWPDELTLRCTVGTLAETGRRHNVTKTAVVLVGDFLDGDYERSRLYHPSFSTEFRKAADAD